MPKDRLATLRSVNTRQKIVWRDAGAQIRGKRSSGETPEREMVPKDRLAGRRRAKGCQKIVG